MDTNNLKTKDTALKIRTSELVPALEKAIAILNYLESIDGEASLTTISDALKLPKSSTFRLLNTLNHHGYIVQEGANGLYTLGPRLLSLANAVHRKLNIIKVALPFMTALKDITGETVKLSILKAEDAIVIAKVESNNDMHATTRIGSRFPLHAGAASKILLAHSQEIDLDSFLREELPRYTPNTICDPQRLREELVAIRTKGFAEDNEERFEGIKALACPVLEYTNLVVAAVSIPYLATRSNELKRKEMLVHLFSCARNISEALGHR
jgi:DNA-binding IclR family transcriptional regulator